MTGAYEIWLNQVQDALRSINMHIEDWRGVWPFDFGAAYKAGMDPDAAAMKANRYWWYEQNKSLKKDCQKTPSCWLPRGHLRECELNYEPGDYVKVEFPDQATGIGEWMWMRVDRRDDEKHLVFGTLDNEPLNDYAGKVKLGSQLVVSYAQVRKHKSPAEFRFTN